MNDYCGKERLNEAVCVGALHEGQATAQKTCVSGAAPADWLLQNSGSPPQLLDPQLPTHPLTLRAPCTQIARGTGRAVGLACTPRAAYWSSEEILLRTLGELALGSLSLTRLRSVSMWVPNVMAAASSWYDS
jgi:hypothetical protein